MHANLQLTDPQLTNHQSTARDEAPLSRPRSRWRFFPLRAQHDDRGSVTAEYAVATMAAVGFAGLLVVILRGDEVRGILTELVRNALSIAG